jgi:putative membrane protein insertion efficiency factor
MGDRSFSERLKVFLRVIIHLPRNLICLIIKIYQKTLSFDHGPLKKLFPYGYCKYKPTCSEYSYDAIKEYGVIKGTILGTYRILRCNPCSKGGYDPVKK